MPDKRYTWFVKFRLPGEKNIHHLENVTVKTVGIPELGVIREGFIFFPFDGEKGFWISPKKVNGPEWEAVFPPANNPTDKNEYLALCRLFIEEIKNGNFGKLVLSKVKLLLKGEKTSDHIFSALCDNYQDAFVYHLCLPFAGEWMGASPELLMDYKNGTIQTVALAGTQKTEGSGKEIFWEGKEKNEQQLVSDFIGSAMEKNGILFEKSETKTVTTGSLAHLKTVFTAKSGKKEATLFLKDIHPTPAVCGTEKEKARTFISSHEKHSRKFYTGFSGPVSEDEMHLFVNLRCMQVHNDYYELFTGGGITADSDPDKEWEETEWKAGILERFLK